MDIFTCNDSQLIVHKILNLFFWSLLFS